VTGDAGWVLFPGVQVWQENVWWIGCLRLWGGVDLRMRTTVWLEVTL
jgi:hypothetical protein